MQYTNRRAASTARAIIKTVFAILSIGLVVTLLGVSNSPGVTKIVFAGLLAIAIIFATTGGMYEMIIQADSTFADITCSPILQTKGRNKTYSIPAETIQKVRRTNFLFIHYIRIEYIGHNGKTKTARLGMTLMGHQSRRKFLGIVEKMQEHRDDVPGQARIIEFRKATPLSKEQRQAIARQFAKQQTTA